MIIKISHVGNLLLSIIVLSISAQADTNLVITSFNDGILSWTNIDTNLYYTVQWKPSLTGTNEWSGTYYLNQDLQSTNNVMSAPAPMFFRIVASSNPLYTALAPTGLVGYRVEYNSTEHQPQFWQDFETVSTGFNYTQDGETNAMTYTYLHTGNVATLNAFADGSQEITIFHYSSANGGLYDYSAYDAGVFLFSFNGEFSVSNQTISVGVENL